MRGNTRLAQLILDQIDGKTTNPSNKEEFRTPLETALADGRSRLDLLPSRLALGSLVVLAVGTVVTLATGVSDVITSLGLNGTPVSGTLALTYYRKRTNYDSFRKLLQGMK